MVKLTHKWPFLSIHLQKYARVHSQSDEMELERFLSFTRCMKVHLLFLFSFLFEGIQALLSCTVANAHTQNVRNTPHNEVTTAQCFKCFDVNASFSFVSEKEKK